MCTLNTLQTNASALDQVRRERGHPQLQLVAMKSFLERSGLTVSPCDQLARITVHVVLSKRQKQRIDNNSFLMRRIHSFIISCFSFCSSKVPDLDQLNIIHVTGTKGKVGLVIPCNALTNMLHTHVFTFRLRSRTLDPVFARTACRKPCHTHIHYWSRRAWTPSSAVAFYQQHNFETSNI